MTDPHHLAEPVTGVHGHPGLWLIDLPPRLSTDRNAPRLTGQSRPELGRTYWHMSMLAGYLP